MATFLLGRKMLELMALKATAMNVKCIDRGVPHPTPGKPHSAIRECALVLYTRLDLSRRSISARPINFELDNATGTFPMNQSVDQSPGTDIFHGHLTGPRASLM